MDTSLVCYGGSLLDQHPDHALHHLLFLWMLRAVWPQVSQGLVAARSCKNAWRVRPLFDQDRIYIGICVAGYFLFTGLVQLIDMLASSLPIAMLLHLTTFQEITGQVIKTSVICLKVLDPGNCIDRLVHLFSRS